MWASQKRKWENGILHFPFIAFAIVNQPPQARRPFSFSRWWYSLPEHRQDRFASLGPLLAVLLFVLAVLFAMAYLRMQEITAARRTLEHDGGYAHQHLSVRLARQREALERAARQLAEPGDAVKRFGSIAEKAGEDLPELRNLIWLDARGKVMGVHPSFTGQSSATGMRVGQVLPAAETALLARVRQGMQPVYGIISQTQEPFADPVLGLMVPVRHQQGSAKEYLYARYSLPSVLYYGIPADVYPRYAVTLLDTGSRTTFTDAALARDSGRGWSLDWLWPQDPAYTLPLPVEELALRLQAYRTSAVLRNRMLLLLVLALSVFTGWMLIANWRHLRRRQRAQQVLQAETNFRRAMENSLLTGMRALDLQGRITSVNASFCRMTGMSEAELVGQSPPFSFWHSDDQARNTQMLRLTLGNKMPRGGYEMRVRRKDGSVFDARMYMSPLIGSDGAHTGWMSSMTDITEPKRVRRELAASQERFARVLDAIDTAVSVAPLGAGELLFANRLYRQWFGEDHAKAHVHMLEEAGRTALENKPQGGNIEIHLEQTQRWVEVRSRYLEWTDGRLAQLVIATDITARRMAEERSAQHELRAQAASRLVTMGEMASSVAHELNQPLTAIHNYCSGMRDRLANNAIQPHELLGALEKTAKQAQRAGQIIQRIREFVKRSAPSYAWVSVRDIVGEAVDLADIEMRRRQVRLSHRVAHDVHEVMADRILIEQVLVNLMKNAAEAIDNEAMPVERREVHLEVESAQVDGKDVVRFVLCDRGKGLSEEVLSHLFEAFFTTKGEGLGIGLNLCRSIVESHQGRLHAENLYNAGDRQDVTGCCFSFWLPLQPVFSAD